MRSIVKREWLVSWVIFPLLIIGIFFILFSQQEMPETVIIADAKQPAFGLIYIADEKGFFKEEGIRLAYRQFAFGKDALADMLAGNSDFATVFETPAVHALIAGEPIAILSSLHHSTKNTRLVANANITSARDLASKRIGVVQGTNLEFFLAKLLQEHGVPESNVTVVNMLPEQYAESLDSNNVDAVVAWNMPLQSLQNKVSIPISEIYSDTYTEVSMLATSFNYTGNKKGTITKMLRALKQAQEFYEQNPEEARNIIIERLRPHMPEADAAHALANLTLDMTLDNVLLSILDQEAEFFYFANSSSTIPNFKSHIATEYLKTVSPESVTLF